MGIERLDLNDAEAAVARVADLIADGLRAGLAARGRASFVATGGSSPRRIYPRLAQADLDWSRVHVTLSDERRVPVDHADSNERQLREILLTGPAAAAKVTGLQGTAEQAGIGVSRLPRPFDVVHLGVGDDGHIASLFPGHSAVLATDGLCIEGRAPVDPKERISLTAPALLFSRQIVLFVTGRKRRWIDRALSPGPAFDLPLRLVLDQNRVAVTVVTAP